MQDKTRLVYYQHILTNAKHVNFCKRFECPKGEKYALKAVNLYLNRLSIAVNIPFSKNGYIQTAKLAMSIKGMI